MYCEKNLVLSLKTTIIDFFETQVFIAPLSANIVLIYIGISQTKCNIQKLDDLSTVSLPFLPKQFLVFSVFTDLNYFFQISGPLLSLSLRFHSMVRLEKGQAILGGESSNDFQAKIYSMTCSNRNCIISLLNRELSVPKGYFVAIPIPDTISGCITGGKNYIRKITFKISMKFLQ